MEIKLPPWFYWIFLIFGLLLIIMPITITQSWFPELTFSSSDGSIGDTIGGTTAPFIGFAGVLMTFLAFYIQYDANQQLKKDIRLDRFENRFYELLKLHKENVNEIEIGNRYFGRKALIRIYGEFKFIYKVVEDEWNNLAKSSNLKKKSLSEELKREDLLSVAYNLFFIGIPREQNEDVKPSDYDFTEECKSRLWFIRSTYFNEEKRRPTDYHKLRVNGKSNSYSFQIDYFPFDGHSAKLGHYFRHLYQMLKMVILSPSFEEVQEKDREIKYSYIKTIRAQLSNHEQTMIYYNSFFEPGKIWWGDNKIKERNADGSLISYFMDWAIIKNIPYNLASFGIAPKEKFIEQMKFRNYDEDRIKKELPKLFEWEED
ncbi:putative phage abortive infection protein [Ekhidna sp.]|uniref:putative phage abortive infection protein n=1 Tax=Ekhidna sp. TaxID=2608089 RepID=UPI003296F907